MPAPTTSLVDQLIACLEDDLMLEEGGTAASPRPSTVPRYDLLASLGYLVSQQSRANPDELRALAALQTLVSGYLSEETPPSLTEYHRRMNADLSAMPQPSTSAVDAIFGSP